MAEKSTLLVGTRDSLLARLQTDLALKHISSVFPELKFELHAIKTSGDKILNKPLAELGGRGVFTKELEDSLLQNEVDLVVHSLKDLPTQLPAGLQLAATILRSDPRDVLVCRGEVLTSDLNEGAMDSGLGAPASSPGAPASNLGASTSSRGAPASSRLRPAANFAELPPGSRVASSSRRRAAQLSAIRKDLEFVDIRGNIQTRMRKLDEGQCDAMILAAAGLLRLGLEDRIQEYFSVEVCMPAVGQGALGIECRADDLEVLAILSKVNDPDVWACVQAERAFLNKLGGGCAVPVGAHATLDAQGRLELRACVAALKGETVYTGTAYGERTNPEALGLELAEKLIAEGAAEIIRSLLELSPGQVSPP